MPTADLPPEPEEPPARRAPYVLLGADRRPYPSSTPGRFGGHRRNRIYGRLDCRAARTAIDKGGYAAYRTFFAAGVPGRVDHRRRHCAEHRRLARDGGVLAPSGPTSHRRQPRRVGHRRHRRGLRAGCPPVGRATGLDACPHRRPRRPGRPRPRRAHRPHQPGRDDRRHEHVALYRIRVGRRIGSTALIADGLHARTDGFTSLAVVAGAAGVLAGFPLADPLVGLLITAAILVVLSSAARDIYRRLMDAVDPTLVDTAEHTLRAVPGVVDVEGLRLRWIGHRIHAGTGLVVHPALSVVDGHAIAADAHHQLLHDVPELATATVHVSPAGPEGNAHHNQLQHHH